LKDSDGLEDEFKGKGDKGSKKRMNEKVKTKKPKKKMKFDFKDFGIWIFIYFS